MNLNQDLYAISNEYNVAEILSHFDSDVVLDIMEDKIQNMNLAATYIQPNIVDSFENNFKAMQAQFPGDSDNIRSIRARVYMDIIEILCKHFNLQFNTMDDSIDLYTAAYYLYDFLVCNFKTYMENFFTSFIINNKDSLYRALDLDALKKNKDSSMVYNKMVYDDNKFVVICSNLGKVIKYISTMDITLENIFKSTYASLEINMFLCNAFMDLGDFFRTHYCSIVNRIDIMPIIITDVSLQLNTHIGNYSPDNIRNYINKGE